MSNPIHSNPAGINSRQQGQSPNPSHPRSHERRLSSNNPFRSEYNDNAYPEGQSSLSPRHPQHPQPAAIRAVNSSASHYNNSTSPQFSSPYPNANAVYRPPSYVGSGVPSIIGTDPHDNYNPNLHPTFENDSKPYPASDMSSIDSLARSPRPTSEVFNNISQKQRQISFAIYEGEEINLSDPNLNYANGPGFLSTPNDSQTDVSATQDLQRDPTIMKRTRWGTQRNKKGRPPKRSKSNKSVLSRDTAQNRISSAGSATSNNGGSPSHLGDASINDQASDTPNGAGNGTHRVYINMKLPEDMIDPETGLPIIAYPRNKIRTTKYTPLSFLPKNLFYQFQNIANVYFLFIVILGAFTIFGVQSPGLSAVPIIVIVAITAVKDAIEDYRRTLLDLQVNNTKTQLLSYWHNSNVTDDNISAWRRFKKSCSRLMFRMMSSMHTASENRKAKKDPNYRPNLDNNYDLTTVRTVHSIDSDHEMQDLSNRRHSRDMRRSIESIHSIAMPDDGPFGDPAVSLDISGSQGTVINPHLPVAGTARFRYDFWKNVRVGDFVRVKNDDEIPADLLILATSDNDGACYVETKNLDGETNLKVRQALKCGQRIRHSHDCEKAQFWIETEPAHANLYSFNGVAKWYDYNSPDYDDSYPENSPVGFEAVTINNVLLRGCSLRNTDWVIGVALFTGPETKIMLNAGETPTKKSRISRELNWSVICNFAILLVICFLSGLINGIQFGMKDSSIKYFEFGSIGGSPPVDGLVTFWAAVILYQSLVPISLYISIEIVKTIQAFFIYSDVNIYYAPIDYPCTPKSWNISDDLGQIEYVFSDKTGTLTQNVMEFKKCTINGVAYGKAYTEALAGMRKRDGIDVEVEGREMRRDIADDKIKMLDQLRSIHDNEQLFDDNLTFISSEFVGDIQGNSGEEQQEACKHFMLALALCHSVITEPSKKYPERIDFKAQSPDEAALVATARDTGFTFKDRTRRGVIVNVQGKEVEFQILNTLEFNSTRKRMSAIVKFPGKTPNSPERIVMICKGADSIIYSRLTPGGQERLSAETALHLEQFASEGLRTLCIAERELTPEEYQKFAHDHELAASALENREEKMEEVADAFERNLTLLGGTAIEDRLQDGVPQTIALLGMAGIKLWVLTGDKVETAINIGFSANLLDNGMELIILRSDVLTLQAVDDMITDYLEKYFNIFYSDDLIDAAKLDHTPPSPDFAVIVDGDTLKLCLDEELKLKFLILCKQCKSVLCCRVSPAQKASVVSLVKNTLDVMTLSIGDGANDVAMIQEADVGVGIAGEEGRQAVMSSDYAIGQFKFLGRLLLVHGRWSYKRLAEMIPNFFFKNVVFTFALFWYGIFSSFDGAYLFEYTYVMFFNLAFTSLPVILMGFLDQDVEDRISLAVPQLYRRGILRVEWNQSKFWAYMADGLYQSLISFFFPFFTYLGGVSISDSGRALDHRYWMGVSVCTIAVVSCNFYIISNQYRWDVISLTVAIVSSWLVWLWSGIYSAFVGSQELYQLANELYQSASFWSVILLGIITCALPHYCLMSMQKIFDPEDVDIIREQWSIGIFDSVPPITDENDGLTAAQAFEKTINAALSLPDRNADGAASHVPGAATLDGTNNVPRINIHGSSDEEDSEDTYPEKDLSSASSSGGDAKHPSNRLSMSQRREQVQSWVKRKSMAGDREEYSDEDPLASFGPYSGPSNETLSQPSGAFFGDQAGNNMTGHAGASRRQQVPMSAGSATSNSGLLRNAGSSQGSDGAGNSAYQYRRHDYPENDKLDMSTIRKSLDIARARIRNEQPPPRKSRDVVRMSVDLGDDLTTAEGLMRTYTRQQANENDQPVRDEGQGERPSRIRQFFHRNHHSKS